MFTEKDFQATLRDCGILPSGEPAAFLAWKFGLELFASAPDEDPASLASLAGLVLKDMAVTARLRKANSRETG